MSAGTIAVLKPGHTMTDAYRQKFLEANPASFSIAVTDKKLVEYLKVNGDKHDLSKALFEIEMKFKDRLLIVGGMAQDDQVPEEAQPFELVVNKDGKPVLVAFVSGDFSVYMNDAAEYAPEATMVMEWLADTCTRMYTEAGEDIHKLMQLLESPAFRKEIQEHLEPAGVVYMLSTDGAALSFARHNNTYAKFDWGEVTNAHGYSEKKTPVTVEAPAQQGSKEPVAQKVLSYKERQAAKLQKPASAPTVAEAPPVVRPTNVPIAETVNAPPPTAVATPKTSVPEIKRAPVAETSDTRQGDVLAGLLYPPKTLAGRYLRKWYTKHRDGGHKGIVWDERPGLAPFQVAKSSHFYPLLNPTATKAADTSTKDTAVHTPSVEVHTKPVPLAPPDQVAKAVKLIKEDAALPMSEAQLKAVVEKYTPFSQRHGITFEHMCCLSFETIYNIGKDAGLKDLATMTHELRCWILQNHPDIMKSMQTQQTKEEEKPPVVITEAPRQLSYKERQAMKLQKAA